MPGYQLNGRPTTGDYQHHFVYALFCKDDNGPGYVKFGRTKNVGQRLTTLRTTCPIPARMYAIVEIGPSLKLARRVEKALLDRFSDRRISSKREWVRFDFGCEQSKRDFNSGCREVFLSTLGPNHEWWQKVSIKALDEAEKARRLRFLKSREGKKIRRRQKSQQRFKELSGITT